MMYWGILAPDKRLLKRKIQNRHGKIYRLLTIQVVHCKEMEGNILSHFTFMVSANAERQLPPREKNRRGSPVIAKTVFLYLQ